MVCCGAVESGLTSSAAQEEQRSYTCRSMHVAWEAAIRSIADEQISFQLRHVPSTMHTYIASVGPSERAAEGARAVSAVI